MLNFPCSLTRNITPHSMKNLFLIAYSDERWLYHQFSQPHFIHFSFKGWGNVHFSLGMKELKHTRAEVVVSWENLLKFPASFNQIREKGAGELGDVQRRPSLDLQLSVNGRKTARQMSENSEGGGNIAETTTRSWWRYCDDPVRRIDGSWSGQSIAGVN